MEQLDDDYSKICPECGSPMELQSSSLEERTIPTAFGLHGSIYGKTKTVVENMLMFKCSKCGKLSVKYVPIS